MINDLNDGIAFLINNLEIDDHSRWLTDITQLNSRYTLLQKQYNQRIITQEEYTIEYNKITKSLITQVDEICQNNPIFKNHNIYCRLIVENGHIVDYPVFNNDEIIVGRSVDADIKLESPIVSRNHCKIFISHQVLRVMDLKSTNGTLINGFRIKNSVIKLGDEIQVGNNIIKVFDTLKTADW
ncbi:MAG: FHA domain-containing protein [Leptospiraceae bacterium]|nr:FHA domain-containing protein [Leptospiraceae bacterium]